MVPYYSKATTGIRKYYRFNNDAEQIKKYIAECKKFKDEHKRDNNIRALNSFMNSSLKDRKITINKLEKYEANINGIDIRVSFELCGLENNRKMRSLLHFQKTPISYKSARLTLVYASWVMSKCGIHHKPRELEYVDLSDGSVKRIYSVKDDEINSLIEQVDIINEIWPTI